MLQHALFLANEAVHTTENELRAWASSKLLEGPALGCSKEKVTQLRIIESTVHSKAFVQRLETATKEGAYSWTSRRWKTQPTITGGRICGHAKAVDPQAAKLTIGGKLIFCSLAHDMIQTFRRRSPLRICSDVDTRILTYQMARRMQFRGTRQQLS